ncbi:MULTISPECIES: S8 family serine peptidase [Marinobacter]|uniref:Peptidase S8/S53 domain-containing protein n=1 Tax=Marinobacter profundi TaxID=2666256 RepID=A0A2G1UIN6_9GAMM|nr:MULTISPECIES: S8 family serine peptidase [Marinobacter]MBD3655220.1 S8 family serine peptidase [Marinobacter sp.]PHQ14322.1 hypothetical protein CLH61_13455 [Marinobacter profundi]
MKNMKGRLVAGGLSLATLMAGCSGGGDSDGSTVIQADLSGTISIESGTRVDSDTADDFRVGDALANNTLATAQALPSSAIVGGYLSATSGTYAGTNEFQFNYVADGNDYFRINLGAGSRVALQVFESDALPAPDVRLEIAGSNGATLYDSDVETAGTPPFLTVIEQSEADAGPHVVHVSTTGGGPFRYVLTVAPEGAASVMNTAYSEPEFVPDEAIVIYTAPSVAGPSLSGAGHGATQAGSFYAGDSARGLAVAGALAAAEVRHLGGNTWRVRRNPGPGQLAVPGPERARQQAETLAWIAELKQHSGVASAEPNYLYRAQAVIPDDDPLYLRQWNYPLINLPVAWQAAPDGGSGVGIAVLDTGLFSSTPDTYGNWHPDANSNVVLPSTRILDYVTGDLDLDNQPGRDLNPADPGNQQLQSSSFHGTHVAGIAAATDNTIGGIGVAPRATLVPVRVLGRDGIGSSDDLIAAITWAGAQSDVDVINLSLGGLAPTTALSAAIDGAYANGKLLVAAAGNQATDELTYPAAFARVVGVGAVDAGKVRASYSNIGGSVDLVAPGGDASRDANLDGNADVIISNWGSDDGGVFVPGYAGLQGTSMAAPHVAGVYALMKAEMPGLTPDEFFALLRNGDLTEPVGSTTEYGAGLIDALKAVSAALDGNIPTVLAPSPTALQFSDLVLSQSLAFSTYPSGETTVIRSVTVDAGWLTVGPELAVGQQPPAQVSVSVDPAGLDPEVVYSTDILISYDSPDNSVDRTLRIPVTLRLGQADDSPDAGRHYVLLVSTDASRDTIQQQVVTAVDGQYRFAFETVAPGDYFLVAGTDMDNNGLICENGEACAEYPVNGLPQIITVGADPISGVTLGTSFRRPTISALGVPRYGFEGYRVLPAEADKIPLRSTPTP